MCLRECGHVGARPASTEGRKIFMTRKNALVVIAITSLAAGLLASAPALGITGGSPDTVHTNVGLVRFTAEGE
jgi:hypothetical protein